MKHGIYDIRNAWVRRTLVLAFIPYMLVVVPLILLVHAVRCVAVALPEAVGLCVEGVVESWRGPE